MMAQTNLNIRVDEDIKKQADTLFAGLGMNMSTAVNIFLRQALRRGGVPFDIVDPFYGEYNQRRLHDSIAQYQTDGVVIMKTMAELEALEKDE